jgi:hypothetical protein
LDVFASVPLSVEQGSPVKAPLYQKPLRPGESEVRKFDLNEEFVTVIWLVLIAVCI